MITREDVIRNAQQYLNIQAWHPLRDKHIFNPNNAQHTFQSAFVVGEEDQIRQVSILREYNVIPYVYGGFDRRTSFSGRINNQSCPGGWDRVSGYGTKKWYDPPPHGFGYGARVPQNLAGIDCSGYVSRCWELTQKYSTQTLPNISLQINRDSLKRGDILNRRGHHVRIFDSWAGTNRMNIYEAVGGGRSRPFNIGDDFGCVVYHALDWNERYVPYSPFPQFIEFTLDDTCTREVDNPRPIISVTCAGSGVTDVTTMYLDNSEVNFVGQCVTVKWRIASGKTTKGGTRATYTPNGDLSLGRHRIEVIATNSVEGSLFCDRFRWVFDVR